MNRPLNTAVGILLTLSNKYLCEPTIEQPPYNNTEPWGHPEEQLQSLVQFSEEGVKDQRQC